MTTASNTIGDAAVIVLATRNAGKIRELNDMLRDTGVTVVGLDAYPEIGEIEETGVTFEENALLKARTVAELTGRIAVADDSGLEVDALGGAPGVYSARYSAEDGVPATDARNNDKLLAALSGVPDAQRAFFHFQVRVFIAGYLRQPGLILRLVHPPLLQRNSAQQRHSNLRAEPRA